MRACLFLIASFLLIASCNLRNDRIVQLDGEARAALQSWQWQRLDSLATLMGDEARSQDNALFSAKADYYLATYRPEEPPKAAQQRYQQLLGVADRVRKTGNDKLLSSVYNTMGAYEMGLYHRYATAQYYFIKAAEVARNVGDTKLEIVASVNLSEACRVLGDTLGRATDERLARLALAADDSATIFIASLHLGLYYLNHESDTARFFQCVAHMRGVPRYVWVADALMAHHLLRQGKPEQALAQIEKAKPDQQTFSDNIRVAILSRLGRYEEANQRIDSLLSGNLETDDLLDHDSLMSLKAANLHALGRDGEAYQWQKRAAQWRKESDRARSLDQTNRARVEYQVSEKNHQIAQQHLQLRQTRAVAVAVVAALLLIMGATLYYTRKRRQFYRTLVAKQMPAELPAPQKESTEADPLWQTIESQVIMGALWRDPTVTRDTLAERLATNRTYLTDCIRRHTGLSYTAFMNKLRVEEAVKVLSTDAEVSLQKLSESLGFLTINTFYTEFRKATGVPPGTFHRTAIDLAKKANAL